MGVREKSKSEKSLLETAVELLRKKEKPQNINKILEEVMTKNSIDKVRANELAPQFLLDFMQSGIFVYCGDDRWDLKERQPISLLDKDGGEYEKMLDENEDVKNNMLKDDDTYFDPDELSDEDRNSEEEDDDKNNDDEDLTREFAEDEEEDDIKEIDSNEGEKDESEESDDDEDIDLSDEFFEDEK